MDCNDPDLEAFDSNLRAIIWARELDETAALLFNICPNASESMIRPSNGGRIEQRKCSLLNANPTAAHHLMASLIRTIYRMIMKHPQNGRSKGTSILQLPRSPCGHVPAGPSGPQRKLMNMQFGQQWVTNSLTVPVPVQCPAHKTVLHICGWARQEIVETADDRRQERFLCADFSKLPQHPGIPFGNVGFLTLLFAWRVQAVLCGGLVREWGVRKSRDTAWPRYSMAHIIMEPVLYGLAAPGLDTDLEPPGIGTAWFGSDPQPWLEAVYTRRRRSSPSWRRNPPSHPHSLLHYPPPSPPPSPIPPSLLY